MFRSLIITCFVISGASLPDQASSSDESIVYRIAESKWLRAPGEIEVGVKCVFVPILRQDQRPRRMNEQEQQGYAQHTVEILRSLKRYTVLTQNNQVLNVRFQNYSVAGTDLPRFFATASKPMQGCGDYLTTGKLAIHTATPPEELKVLRTIFEGNEKTYYMQALNPIPKWISDQDKEAIEKHDLARSFANSRRSKLETFYDGKDWYLVRSYVMEGHVHGPTTLITMNVYRLDAKQMRITPSLTFINTAFGVEGYWVLEYSGAMDLDGDGTNEMIVIELGEAGGYSYLRISGDRWVYQ